MAAVENPLPFNLSGSRDCIAGFFFLQRWLR